MLLPEVIAVRPAESLPPIRGLNVILTKPKPSDKLGTLETLFWTVNPQPKRFQPQRAFRFRALWWPGA